MSDTDPKCAKCGKRRSEHNYRHPFVGPSRDDTINALSAHIEELEAKLAKAGGALEFYNEVLTAFSSATDATADVADETLDRDGGKLARATLAEIKGENT